MSQTPFLVIGLGNPVISDDAAGLAAVEEAKTRLQSTATRPHGDVEFILDTSGGIDLLYVLENRERVLLVDAVSPDGAEAGSVFEIPFAELSDSPRGNPFTTHYASIPELLSLGARLGMAMPSEIRILAIAAKDLETIAEGFTPMVERAIPLAATRICAIVEEWLPHL